MSMNPADGTATAPPQPSPAILAKLINTSSRANRRSSSRRSPRGNVVIEVRKGKLGLANNVSVLFLDLAEGGVSVVVDEAIQCGCEVEVRITSSGLRKPLKSFGTVRWMMPLDDDLFCVGIQFEKRLSYRDVAMLVKP
jgi:hypothetical protein